MCITPNDGNLNAVIEQHQKLTDTLEGLDPQSVDRKPLEQEWLRLEQALRQAIPKMKPSEIPAFQPRI